MTESQERSMLETYRYDSGENGIYRLRVGARTEDGRYIAWSYSDKRPINRDRAFWYWVSKDGNNVMKSNRPLSIEDAREAFALSFGINMVDRDGKVMLVVPGGRATHQNRSEIV